MLHDKSPDDFEQRNPKKSTFKDTAHSSFNQNKTIKLQRLISKVSDEHLYITNGSEKNGRKNNTKFPKKQRQRARQEQQEESETHLLQHFVNIDFVCLDVPLGFLALLPWTLRAPLHDGLLLGLGRPSWLLQTLALPSLLFPIRSLGWSHVSLSLSLHAVKQTLVNRRNP